MQDSAGSCLPILRGGQALADGRPIRLAFVVLTKTKTLEVCWHEVQADRRQIDRAKRIVERVWRAVDAGIFSPSPSAMQCPTCASREARPEYTG